MLMQLSTAARYDFSYRFQNASILLYRLASVRLNYPIIRAILDYLGEETLSFKMFSLAPAVSALLGQRNFTGQNQ
jgi:hypothetical protein